MGETSAQLGTRSIWRRLATAQEAGLVLVIALLMTLLTVLGGLPAYSKPKDATFISLPAGVTEAVEGGVLVITTDSEALARDIAGELPESMEGNLAVDHAGTRKLFESARRPSVTSQGGEANQRRLVVFPPGTTNAFLNKTNLFLVLVFASFIAIMAVGMTAIITMGGIDLSVGSIYALAAIFGAVFLRYDWSHGLPGVTLLGSGLYPKVVGALAVLALLAGAIGPRAVGTASPRTRTMGNVAVGLGVALLFVLFWRFSAGLIEAGETQTARSALGLGPSLAIGLGVCCALGAAAGWLNGVMIVGLRVHPFIITLGMMAAVRGLVAIPTKAQSVGDFPEAFTRDFFQSAYLDVKPVPVLVMLVAVVLGMFVLSRTVLGRRLYAIGGNETAAHYAGIPVGRVKIIAYTLMGLLAGLSACVYLGYFGAAETNAGNGYELQVIAAAVIGGASLSGGRGSALGAVLGAILVQLLNNGMLIIKIDQNYVQIVMGAAIILAVVLDQLKARLLPQGR